MPFIFFNVLASGLALLLKLCNSSTTKLHFADSMVVLSM